MDVVHGDFCMKNSFEDWETSKGPGRDEGDDNGVNHFIAFLPFEGHLWKMDGLERQPLDLGNNCLAALAAIEWFTKNLLISV